MIAVTTVTHTIAAPTSSVDVKANFAPSNSLPYIFHQIVASGVTLTGTPSVPCLDTNTGWHGGAQIVIDNRGTWTAATGSSGAAGATGPGGAGGLGGDSLGAGGVDGKPGSGGGTGGTGSPGGIGGDAFKVQIPVYLMNATGVLTRGNAGPGGPGGTGGGGGGGGGGACPGVGGPPSKTPFSSGDGGRGGDGNTNAGQNLNYGPQQIPPNGWGGPGGGPGATGGTGNNSGARLGAGGGGPGATGPAGPVGSIGNAINGVSKLRILSTGTITGPQIG